MPDRIYCFMVDDDIDDQEIFAIAIRESGFDVVCDFAKDGIDALTKLEEKEQVPDFIFLDLNMPRMNGIHCLIEIKKTERLSKVPVIIYSTSAESKFIEEAKMHGASEYLIKPSSIKELTKSVLKIFRSNF
jgi:CheY-like chemotaxis protein